MFVSAQENQKNRRLERDHAMSLLHEDLIDHNLGLCKCHPKYGKCYAGMWLWGLISNKQVIEDKSQRVGGFLIK